jgi:Ca-activated chloride channel family protein
MRRFSFLFVIFAFSAIFTCAQTPTQGSLYASGKNGVLGECPLKNTAVKADISGFLARVTVMQEFENSFSEPIEAVYTFPLSQNSAVDDMTMKIGERTIRGRIMKREEARKVYEQAKTEGKTASLLDQQRPNIFTQSVANIMPGDKILIEISYVETLKFEDGQYEFVFPMTVGPRYIPKSVEPKDAQSISPKIEETRNGSDISIEVNLDAGVPTEGIYSTSHPIALTNLSSNSAKISLREDTTIPNKDFVLRYDVTGKRIEDALLAHRAEKGGFFSLILSPPDDFKTTEITPKEIVFVLDTSGSMSGFPIEKAKEAMRLSLDGLNPQDTFNLITFAGDTSILFEKPVPATADNLARAKAFLESRNGAGGTEMMKAIRAALEPTDSQKHLRVVCFMTDGYVGNEAEIIAEIQKHPKARIFSFGIGNAVNRFLLDKMAEEGHGEVQYVALNEDGSKAAKKFFERVRTPLLTDISIDWNGLPVEDVYPNKVGDLFSAKPVVLNGRYTKAAKGTIQLKGYVGGKLLVRNISVNLPDNEPDHDVLATLWARRRVDSLMSDFYKNQQNEKAKNEIQEQITSLGIEFRILTQFTSFVAVEEQIVNQNGKPTRVEVPVVAPDGMKNNSDSSIGNSFSAQQIMNLPMNGRSISALTTLQPGTTVDSKSRNVKQEESSGGGMGNGTGYGRGQGSGYGNGNGNGDGDSLVSNEIITVSSPDGAVTAILKRMEEHQKALKTLNAAVKMDKFNTALGETETYEGTLKYLTQAGGQALRLDWIKPNAEVVSILKDQFLLYRPALKTAYSGKTTETVKDAFAVFATVSKDRLKEKFDITFVGEEKLGGATPTWHLELKPKTATNYKTVELWIDANGMINQVKISENNGDWTNILLSKLQKNTQITATDCAIKLPAETKIIKN